MYKLPKRKYMVINKDVVCYVNWDKDSHEEGTTSHGFLNQAVGTYQQAKRLKEQLSKWLSKSYPVSQYKIYRVVEVK